jgi:hypothetical protein
MMSFNMIELSYKSHDVGDLQLAENLHYPVSVSSLIFAYREGFFSVSADSSYESVSVAGVKWDAFPSFDLPLEVLNNSWPRLHRL